MSMGAERLKQNANLPGEVKGSGLTTKNWKLFSQGKLSTCEMEITAFLFSFLFIRLFWLEPISIYIDCYNDLFVWTSNSTNKNSLISIKAEVLFKAFPKEKLKWLLLKYSKLIRCFLVSYYASSSILMKEWGISHPSAKAAELREVNCCCYGNKGPANCFSSIVLKENWLLSWMLHIREVSLVLGWPIACNTGFPHDGICPFDMLFVIHALSVIPSLGFPLFLILL